MDRLIAQRYAQALFDYVSDLNADAQAHTDMQFLDGFLKASPEFDGFLKDPIMSAEKRKSVLSELYKTRLSKPVFIFLLFLGEKGRLGLLKEICEEFHGIYLTARNTVKPKVFTPVVLTDRQVEDLRAALKARLNKDITPDIHLDPDLLGGIRIQIKDQILDFSFRQQLKNFEHVLLHT